MKGDFNLNYLDMNYDFVNSLNLIWRFSVYLNSLISQLGTLHLRIECAGLAAHSANREYLIN